MVDGTFLVGSRSDKLIAIVAVGSSKILFAVTGAVVWEDGFEDGTAEKADEAELNSLGGRFELINSGWGIDSAELASNKVSCRECVDKRRGKARGVMLEDDMYNVEKGVKGCRVNDGCR